MNSTHQRGQSFILVLIILAIGALIVVPALNLSGTTIKNSQRIERSNRGLYACEAAQEVIMWKLYHGELMDELDTPNSSANFTVDVCGTQVSALVVMRAVELEGGTTLATDDTIIPTKSVSPDTAASKNDLGPFTYIISLEQVSSNTTGKLVAIYDVISEEFSGKVKNLYVPGSSYTSTDNVTWTQIYDPKDDYSSDLLLRWPYSDNFSSPFNTFTPGQTKYLKFSITGPFKHNDEVVCNWVVIQVGDVFTVSGAQAPIFVSTSETECTDARGIFEVTKSSNPSIIPPLVSTNVTYTITITNTDNNENFLTELIDYLPPGFSYCGNTTGITTGDPEIDPEPQLINGLERWVLVWDDTHFGSAGYKIDPGANVTLTFIATAEQGVSGNYYNEVIASPKNAPSLKGFTNIPGLSPDFYNETYSWNSGIVIVPAYDTETTAEGENITANMGVSPDGVDIFSWHVE